ncbi:MAG: DUF3110 domain-containing protein, partial [Cyanobacteria bacterium J06607_6]
GALMVPPENSVDQTDWDPDGNAVEEFCAEAGFEAKLVASGALMVPPENSVDQTDWDPDGNAVEEVPPTADESRLSNQELDSIRQQLEKLL